MGGTDPKFLFQGESWKNYAPNWAKESYLEIISYIKLIPWNRKLQWSVSPICSIANYTEGTDTPADGCTV